MTGCASRPKLGQPQTLSCCRVLRGVQPRVCALCHAGGHKKKQGNTLRAYTKCFAPNVNWLQMLQFTELPVSNLALGLPCCLCWTHRHGAA